MSHPEPPTPLRKSESRIEVHRPPISVVRAKARSVESLTIRMYMVCKVDPDTFSRVGCDFAGYFETLVVLEG
jgi:hypothetical protein